MISWILLRTNPSTQARYVDHVQERAPSIETYVPSYQASTRPHRRRHPILVTKPIYPGYIFARPNLSVGEHIILTRMPMKAYLIRFGNHIESIPDIVISELRKLESVYQESLPKDPGPRYKPGQKVLVHMDFTDITATIIRLIAQTRVRLDTPLGPMTVGLHRIACIPGENVVC